MSHHFFWLVDLLAPEPVVAIGQRALRFSFRPGRARGRISDAFSVFLLPQERPELSVQVPERVNLITSGYVDLNRDEWQTVEIPLAAFELVDPQMPLQKVQFSGNLVGTFFLDDVRLVAAKPGESWATAVEESYQQTTPTVSSLNQNYPNPFNSGTVIPFDLDVAGQVELTVYNLAGQEVARLMDGFRNAGRYTVHWDGRDGTGSELATGMYLYRLRTAGRAVQTRKLLLLR